MAELTLHIGTAKTGTTYLQQVWFRSTDVLAAAGWSYPTFVGQPNHAALAAPFASREELAFGYPELKTEAGRIARREELAPQFADLVRQESRWLVTSEGFSIRVKDVADIRALREYFSQWFDTVKAVVYFRRHDYFALSLYSETMRGSGLRSIRDLDIEYLETSAARGGLLGLPDMLRSWQDALGSEMVEARPYVESFKNDPNRLVIEMHALIGIDVAPDQLAPSQNARSSLSQEAILFVRKIAEARDVVLNDLDAQYDDPYLQAVAGACRPFKHPRDTRPRVISRFNDALAKLTKGPKLALSPEVAEYLAEITQREGPELAELAGSGDGWTEWLAEKSAPISEEEQTISVARVRELLAALAATKPIQNPPAKTPTERKIVSLRKRVRARMARAKAN